jgi:carboxypeptidase Q
MLVRFTACFLLICLPVFLNAQSNNDSLMIRRIFDEALTSSRCYSDLKFLCKNIPPRLSGSEGAAKAVSFTQSVFEAERFDRVFLQEMLVPNWKRGSNCSVTVNLKKTTRVLKACALGGSVGGTAEGEIIAVSSLDQLDSLGKKYIEGKIVFFSRPMEPRHIHTFEAYGGCVDQRWAGPSKAAKYGAKATLVRSMNLREDEFPHTGSMSYDTAWPKIPALAISTEDATWLLQQTLSQNDIKGSIYTNCETRPDTLSHNVVGELRGTLFPDKYIICGGHLDAWDNGEGAHDDGAGCMQSIEALRILKNMGYKPRHSLRAVMFMNEENGARGAKRYAAWADSLKEKHIYAIESDRGGFSPRGFAIDSDDPVVIEKIARFRKLLEPYGLHDFKKGGGGVDIGPLKKQGTVCIGLVPDSQRYFDHHHAANDVFEHVNKRELELGAAAMAALIYLLDQQN